VIADEDGRKPDCNDEHQCHGERRDAEARLPGKGDEGGGHRHRADGVT
jgi:hypothetical protein